MCDSPIMYSPGKVTHHYINEYPSLVGQALSAIVLFDSIYQHQLYAGSNFLGFNLSCKGIMLLFPILCLIFWGVLMQWSPSPAPLGRAIASSVVVYCLTTETVPTSEGVIGLCIDYVGRSKIYRRPPILPTVG